MRNELVEIGVVWLGEANAVQVTASSAHAIDDDDFVATIDTIRGLHIEGQDPVYPHDGWEMHQQAASDCPGHDPATNQLVSWIEDHSARHPGRTRRG